MFSNTRSVATTLALALALVGGSGIYNVTFAENKAQKEEKTSDKNVQGELGKALADIIAADGPGKLAGRIAASDRSRVSEALEKANTDDYKKLVKELQDSWKEKYGHAYDPDAHTDELAAANNIDRFEYNGKEYVSVTFPKSQYEPEAELRYAHQGDNYRLTLSNDLTGEQLAARIQRALKRVVTFKSQWTKDEAAAYAGTARLLLATLDYDAQQTRSAERNKK